jgi:acetolactate synthase small subunit
MQQKRFDIVVENSPTILAKIIQVIKRRRIDIHSLLATSYPGDSSLGKIKIIHETDAEKARLIETQLKKLVDVLEVK